MQSLVGFFFVDTPTLQLDVCPGADSLDRNGNLITVRSPAKHAEADDFLRFQFVDVYDDQDITLQIGVGQ